MKLDPHERSEIMGPNQRVVKKKKKDSLTLQAYHLLKKKIISLDLEPGERLNDKKLALEMSLGRTPMREAMLKLEGENLIIIDKAIYVKHITIEDIKDLFETLIVIERFAARLASQRINAEQLREMKRVNKKIEEAMKKRDFLEITFQNSNFHQLLAKASGNRFISSILTSIQNEGQRLAYLSYSKEMAPDFHLDKHFELVGQHHQNIINFLEDRQTEKLENQIVEHVKLFRNRIMRYLTSKESESFIF